MLRSMRSIKVAPPVRAFRCWESRAVCARVRVSRAWSMGAFGSPRDLNARISGASQRSARDRMHTIALTFSRSLSACFRHPRATRGIHLSGECEARVRDISPTESPRHPFPLLRLYNTDVPTNASHVDADLDADPVQVRSGIRDDTTGTNDALSRNIARIWRTDARAFGFTRVGVTGMGEFFFFFLS